jgi:hypothetical protein
MYKKHGRHHNDAESANNDDEQFGTQLFNFMRKDPDIVITQVSITQINLAISTRFTPSSGNSTLDNQKYSVDDINEPTPCTILYVKGRTLRTVKVVDVL